MLGTIIDVIFAIVLLSATAIEMRILWIGWKQADLDIADMKVYYAHLQEENEKLKRDTCGDGDSDTRPI
ncbi:MAG: hypothetical protein LBK57_04690 [Clostridiales Family XIII bacterium]|jgi:hypothetical protein|nr:hypothetical protein [Clostridiales Family XIII bacterium]